MGSLIVVGAQWGDEGKGKVVDFLAGKADWVVRFNGGDNAGHTVVVNDRKVVLHIMPTGALQGKNVAIGPDVFFNPKSFFKDYDEIRAKGFRIGRIAIDERAHVVLPYHIALDETDRTGTGIGTTRRGIGPAAKDKAGRTEDITVADLVSRDFKRRLRKAVLAKKGELMGCGAIQDEKGAAAYADSIHSEYRGYAGRIGRFAANVSLLLHRAIQNRERVLIEGAQGALLDIVHGTRPYTTSTNTVAGGAFANLGISPREFHVLGVVKAYPTRVGNGPFPSEIKGALAEKLREKGGEYGATTGRPRRIGFPDFVALGYSAAINSADSWALTKLDVLSGIRFRAVVAYERNSRKTREFPFRLEECKPVYGTREYYWEELTERECEKAAENGYGSLPEGMREYVEDLVRYTKVPARMISLSPKRDAVTKDVLRMTRRILR